MMFALTGALWASVAGAAAEPVCLGVFFPREDRVLRIMWVDVSGDRPAITAFENAAFAQGYTSKDIKVDDAKSSAHLTFVSPRTTFAMADNVIQRARKGEFGQLKLDTMVMTAADGEMQKCLGSSSKR